MKCRRNEPGRREYDYKIEEFLECRGLEQRRKVVNMRIKLIRKINFKLGVGNCSYNNKGVVGVNVI